MGKIREFKTLGHEYSIYGIIQVIRQEFRNEIA